ncbi:hypothetical protein ABZ318_15545 [Streptomyces sp. NPDC006197]|uniref:hypothetical protein n=1 Tax=Streptomyces sp. NPDC006197 TaxID=3156685 RepID=UPI0033B05028
MAALNNEDSSMAIPTRSGASALPPPRAAQPKQWDCFLALAAVSGSEERRISSREISRATKLSVETLGGILAYLQSVGLVAGSRGTYAVTREGWAVAEAWRQDSAQGRLLLQGLFLARWPARMAYDILCDGPVTQDEFVERIGGEGFGHTRRVRYLVDWLVMALLVHRDAALTVSASSALLASVHQWQSVSALPSQPTAHEPRKGVLMGMTHSELRALPPGHYMAVLKNVVSLSEIDAVG